MEGVGKADSYCETPVEDSRYHLTKDLHKDYNPEVPANLWNKDCPITGTLLYQNSVAQIRLAQGTLHRFPVLPGTYGGCRES